MNHFVGLEEDCLLLLQWSVYEMLRLRKLYAPQGFKFYIDRAGYMIAYNHHHYQITVREREGEYYWVLWPHLRREYWHPFLVNHLEVMLQAILENDRALQNRRARRRPPKEENAGG